MNYWSLVNDKARKLFEDRKKLERKPQDSAAALAAIISTARREGVPDSLKILEQDWVLCHNLDKQPDPNLAKWLVFTQYGKLVYLEPVEPHFMNKGTHLERPRDFENLSAALSDFGYPTPEFLARVKQEEIQRLGITSSSYIHYYNLQTWQIER